MMQNSTSEFISSTSRNEKNLQLSLTAPMILALRHVYFTGQASREALKKYRRSIDQLVTLNDDLVLLLLENTVISVLKDKLKIVLQNYKECQANDIAAGHFCGFNRQVVIADLEDADSDFCSTIIHEFAHAVSFFAFRFDPVPHAAFFPFANEFNKLVTNFLKDPNTPAPTRNQAIFRTDRKIAELANFNAAFLKFKRCVKEDFQQNVVSNDPKLNNFFGEIARQYPAVLDEGGLTEVLPVYMECRVDLLHRAQKGEFTREQALLMLAKKLPRIHDYVETDLKKVLQARIKRFIKYDFSYGLKSEVKFQDIKKNPKAVAAYCPNGCLTYIKR